MSKLVAVVGPTGVGKSRLALALARRFGGEIVNADSQQVYRFLDIGTAKPSREERKEVPHHLYDILDPDEGFSLALYQRLAYQAFSDIWRRGKLPILVGGSGLYIWGVLEGWQIPPISPNPQLRASLERRGREALFQELQRVDAEAAAVIHPHNLRRLIRALEVHYATGVPFSQLQKKAPLAVSRLIIGLTARREELYQRLDSRVNDMITRGWVAEVQGLLTRGYSPDLPSLTSPGYKELALYLQGQIPLEEATRRTKVRCHYLARHQYAWFRLSDPRITWLDINDNLEEKAEALVREFPGIRDCVTAGEARG